MYSNKQRIAIFGGSGLLGVRLVQKMVSFEFDVLSPSSQEVNLLDLNDLSKFIFENKPNIIINLVALTDVNRCEKYPQEAYLVNAKTVQNIFTAIQRANIYTHVVHISTDHLYDNDDNNVSSEEDICLHNYYAYSKYLGELMIAPDTTTVLRTNFFGKSHTRQRVGFTDWLFNSIIKEQKISVYVDVLFSPLSISTLIEMIMLVVDKKLPGVFNLGSKDGLSKADFAFKFADLVGLPSHNMARARLSDVESCSRISRPKNMLMNSFYFEKIYGIKLPELSKEIELVAREEYAAK